MIDHSGFYRVHNGRAYRQADSPYRRRPPRQRIDWARVLMLTGAILLTASVLAYKLTGPA